MKNLLHFIRAVIPLSADEAAFITGLFAPRKLAAGEFFLEEGKICRHVGFIGTGLVRYFLTVAGEERTIYFNRENEFICDYASFLPQLPADKSIQAVEPTMLYTITQPDLQRFYHTVRGGERFGRIVIEQVFLTAMVLLTSMYTDSAPVRYARFLALYPDLLQRVPQYLIASFVGVRPQSLSRIRRRIAENARNNF